MNIYQLVNEELIRLHETLNKEILLEERRMADNPNSYFAGTYNSTNPIITYIRARIDEIEKEILVQFKNHDQKIQEKIAELALTGK